MFDIGSLLQRVQELGAPAPGGWGTTVTPEGGSTMPVNSGGLGDAFMANLKKANPGQVIGKAFAAPPEAPRPSPMPSMPSDGASQAQMGQAGMQGLRAMARPVGGGQMSDGESPLMSMPGQGQISPGERALMQSPFMAAPRRIY